MLQVSKPAPSQPLSELNYSRKSKTATPKTATKPKRRQSKTAIRQNGDTSKTATTKTATYQNGACRRFGLSPFWSVAVLDLSPFWICRRFGFVAVLDLSPFWLYPKRRYAKTATNPKRRHVKTATIQLDLSPKYYSFLGAGIS